MIDGLPKKKNTCKEKIHDLYSKWSSYDDITQKDWEELEQLYDLEIESFKSYKEGMVNICRKLEMDLQESEGFKQ